MGIEGLPKRFARTSFGRALTSSLGSSMVALLGVAGATLGSLETQAIHDSVFFAFARRGAPLSWEGTVFWFLVALNALLFVARQHAVDFKREEQVQKMDAQIGIIPGLVRTAPPTDFLANMAIVFEKGALLTTALLQGTPTPPIAAVRECVREMLQALADLAWKYADAPEKVNYAANLMIFSQPKPDACREAPLIFCEPETDVTKLGGLLVLVPELSATRETNDIDRSLRSFSLPVPRDPGTARSDGGAGYRVLPGAPFAFIRKALELFPDTKKIEEWFHTQGSFPRHTEKAVLDYFDSQASSLKGFVSIPVFRPSAKREAARDRAVCAILNVHWNVHGLLGEPEPAATFEGAIYPVLFLLSQIIDKFGEQLIAPAPRASSPPEVSSEDHS
jgi:hypothetical protein